VNSVLPNIWFIAIALLWIGYLLLEGFDLGVGMHMLITAKDEPSKRVMLNTIGPVWDGNEVWLITAGAAIFAAFPFWYASLFSTLYIALVFLLLGLIFRAVAIEYRGKRDSARWRRAWDWALGLGSFVSAFFIGAALALTTTGLPLDAAGNRVGGPFVWLTPVAVLGGLGVVGFCLVHAAAFLALKSDGPVRVRAGRIVQTWMPIALLPLVGWVLLVQFETGGVVSWLFVLGAVVAVVFAWLAARRQHEGRAFIGLSVFLVLGAAGIFSAAYPVVLPSTISHTFDLTVTNASSSPYTLGVMTVIAGAALPVILAYQAWTYWVFRKRIAPHHLPEVHDFEPAIKR
jgi:cytochrome d ubiquinol oxidase subunit II